MYNESILQDFLDLFNKKWFIALILVFAFLSGFVISLIGIFISNSMVKKAPGPTPVAFSQVSPAPINNNNPQTGVYNVLLLGYGGAGHEGSLLTDSMIVIHVNTNTHKATMISVPRDLWVPGNIKINAAGVNGFKNSEPVVQAVTGLPMNYFVSVDFGDFVKLVDDLGGINVQVPVTFDDPYYPITGQENNTCGFTNDQINQFKAQYQGFDLEKQFTCRYEHLHFDAGTATLDGTTALKFVRSRHGDSDFGRSLRQFAVLQGIGQKLIALRNMNKVNETINTLFAMVSTDLDLGTIKSLIQVLGDPTLYKVNQIQLTTNNVLNEGFASDGEYILTPKAGDFNFSEVKNYINSNL